MKTGKIAVTILLAATFIAGCGKSAYKKTPGGMPYKLYRGKDTQQVVAGSYLKLSVMQKINDSVLMNTATGVPVYIFVDNQRQAHYDVSEIWTSLHVGDSLVTIQMMDTFIKRSPSAIPPQFKNGDRIVSNIKILAMFANDSLARADEALSRKALLTREIVEIEKFLSDKKISAQKTPSGAFVEIIKQGEGKLVDSGNYVSIKYTGISWSGQKFDSNTDTSFHHLEPLSFVVGSPQMIKGLDEAMKFMNKGMVAKVYVPSMLGFGPTSNNPKIKAYEHLVFDVEVLNIQDKAPLTQQPPQPKVDVPQQKNK